MSVLTYSILRSFRNHFGDDITHGLKMADMLTGQAQQHCHIESVLLLCQPK